MAVALLFFANGLSLATWVPRLIDVQTRLNMSDATVGIVLAVGAAGGIALGPWAGRASARWGSGRVAVVTILLFAPVSPLIAVAPSPWVLALILAWMMGMDAISDAAMNAHGIRVQKLYSTSILNSFHGFWSLGTVLGGAIGAGSLLLGVPLLPTLILAAAIAVVATVIAARNLLPGNDPDTHLDEEHVPSFADPGSVGQRFRIASLTPVTLLLGFFTMLAVTVEEIPPRWSSIYLGSIGVDEQFVGISFVAFTIAMMAGRFTGDRLVDRFGEITVVRASMIVTTLALLLGLLSSSLIGFTLACIITGYGVATLFPAAMRAAAHIPGIRPASGVTVVSWLARSGFIIAPLIVGLVAEAAGPGWGIACAAVAAMIIVPLAVVLRWGSTPSPRAANSSG
jgi:MFS family permease